MKRIFQLCIVFSLVAISVFLFVGCEPIFNRKLERSSYSKSSNTLYTYELEVKEYGLGTTEEGRDFIAIKYEFKNNGDNEQSFYAGITDSVFQNGVKLKRVFSFQEENYETYVKSGASVDVVLYYELIDTTTDVEVVLKLGGSTLYFDEEEEAKTITRFIRIAE